MRPLVVAVLVVTIAAGCAPTTRTSGLRAEEPRAQWRYAKVDTRRPEFRWEAFPAPADREADPRLQRAENVRYDLRVWRAESATGYPLTLVYRRDELPEPRHALDEELEPAVEYVWSVRARFDLDGQVRVTPWSCLVPPAASFDPVRSAVLPGFAYYRFKTPAR